MSRRREKRHLKKIDTHEDKNRWMITYSDLITLLLIFFILMFSMSSIENQRFNALISSLRSSFQGTSILEDLGYPSGDKGQTQPPASLNGQNAAAEDQKDQNEEKKNEENKQQFDALYLKLDKYIKENNLDPDVSLTETPRGIRLTFREKILFDLGKADIKPGAKQVLNTIGGILKEVSNEVSIEGHTDNTPFRNEGSPFHSNWELSGARAQTVMNYLIQSNHLPPERFHFVGYGEYKPVVKNDTAAHKAMNRRVNVVVIREESRTTEN